MVGCCPFFGSSNKDDKKSKKIISQQVTRVAPSKCETRGGSGIKKKHRKFTYTELAAATKTFRWDLVLRDDGFGFGPIYKGHLESTGQDVEIRQFDLDGPRGNREFIREYGMLYLMHHPNLIDFIGYCDEGEHRFVVCEFMPLGTLERHLHDHSTAKEPLGWKTRMKIAAGVAKGLEYMHYKAEPSVIYRNLQSSTILLAEDYHPKLSDLALARLGPVDGHTHVSSRVLDTNGYSAPEYIATGQLNIKCDVYSFGVLFLEIITGRKPINKTDILGEHLVSWAQPFFKSRKNLPEMIDPLLEGNFPKGKVLYWVVAITAMCLQEDPDARPTMTDVATCMTHIAEQY